LIVLCVIPVGYFFALKPYQQKRIDTWMFLLTNQEHKVDLQDEGWVPNFLLTAVGFLFTGASSLWPDRMLQSAALHVWAVGGIGTMTLAVMTRATLGHSGRQLVASRATQLIYTAVLAATVLRVAAVFLPQMAMPLIDAAAAAWIAAFIGFALAYGPMLLRPSKRT